MHLRAVRHRNSVISAQCTAMAPQVGWTVLLVAVLAATLAGSAQARRLLGKRSSCPAAVILHSRMAVQRLGSC